MKRVAGIVMSLALLTGAAYTGQSWSGAPAGSAPGPLASMAALLADIQVNGLPWPEPVSIVMASLVLLTGTTLMRRHRASRRA